jgi:hypothetical protein
VSFTSYREIRSPCNETDAAHMRTLAGVMMQHHVNARWYHFRVKIETYLSARNYARRSLEGPR